MGKLRIAALALLAAACTAESRGAALEARIGVRAASEGPWRVEYRLSRPVAQLDLGPSLDGFRTHWWRVRTEGVELVREGDRDFLVARKRGAAFETVVLDIEPRSAPLDKAYQAFTPMGAGGVLLYTGHFTPKAASGGLIDASFDIAAPPGALVSAFDRTAAAFGDWRSPFDLPAFVYVGPERPAETEGAAAIVDARAPDWVKAEFRRLTPELFAHYAEATGAKLKARPNLFVAIGDISVEGRISYRGDALPGQFQATLEGGAWNSDLPEVRRVLLATTAHEAAHLFQLTVGPEDDAPAFIHEGGADALAAEALVAIGRWSAADREAALAEARRECARLIEGRSLLAAEAAKEWRAAYACGHVLTVAAAGPQGPAAFWRRLIAGAAGAGSYDPKLFLAVARETAGPEAADAIGAFLSVNAARPDLALDRILALSGAAGPTLDGGGGR